MLARITVDKWLMNVIECDDPKHKSVFSNLGYELDAVFEISELEFLNLFNKCEDICASIDISPDYVEVNAYPEKYNDSVCFEIDFRIIYAD